MAEPHRGWPVRVRRSELPVAGRRGTAPQRYPRVDPLAELVAAGAGPRPRAIRTDPPPSAGLSLPPGVRDRLLTGRWRVEGADYRAQSRGTPSAIRGRPASLFHRRDAARRPGDPAICSRVSPRDGSRATRPNGGVAENGRH